MRSEQARGLKEHDDNQHKGVDQHAFIRKGAEHFRQEREHGCGADRACNRTHAAEHDHNQDFNGIVKIKFAGIEHADIMRIDAARDPSEKRRHHKGQQFIIGGVDAGGLRRNLILADGNHRAPVAGADKCQNRNHCEESDKKGIDNQRIFPLDIGDSGQTGRAACKIHR